MKILYIDPWCVNGPHQNSNLYHYSTGLVGGLSDYADVTLVCQADCTFEHSTPYRVKKLFFPKSNDMDVGMLRTAIRGIEYISAYRDILSQAAKDHFDVIHVEWPLLYRLDPLILKQLKKHCRILSMKAHNILPHSTGNRHLKEFRSIYAIPDIILVHGESLYREFEKYFPEMKEKVRIQRHGVLLGQSCQYDREKISDSIRSSLEQASRVYLFFGRIDQDKGVDRLADIWVRHFCKSSSILVVAGKPANDSDTDRIKKKASLCGNFIFVPGFMDENLLHYLVDTCHLVLLPYLAGSMSGVAFTAAEFNRTFLATDFGAIREYVENGKNGFVVENSDGGILEGLKMIEKTSNEELLLMGRMLHRFYHEEFSWQTIAGRLVNDVYRKSLEKD